MRTLGIPLVVLAASMMLAACAGGEDEEEPLAGGEAQLTSVRSFVAKGTGYFPANNALQGGFLDRKDAKLRTLQGFLSGKHEYVSVAMDSTVFKYGQRLRIKELNDKYGTDIIFRVVDTGGAFRGKGTTRIDICTANEAAAHDGTINSKKGLHIDVVDDSTPFKPTKEPQPRSTAPAPERIPTPEPRTDPDPTPTPEPRPDPVIFPDPEPLPDFGSSSGGTACGSDGACNPGNDGSGLVCVASRCVPGCRSNAHCPGVTTCQSGQCR
jgi:3D (Asp-Asp-Asp) domain-containing protein